MADWKDVMNDSFVVILSTSTSPSPPHVLAGLSKQIKARKRSRELSHSIQGLCRGLPGVDESLRKGRLIPGSVQNWWNGAAFGPHPPQPLPLPLPQAREGPPDACASKLRFSTRRDGFESVAPGEPDGSPYKTCRRGGACGSGNGSRKPFRRDSPILPRCSCARSAPLPSPILWRLLRNASRLGV